MIVTIILLAGISFLLPADFNVERRIVINAPPSAIYAQVGDLRKWRDWGAWFRKDPDMQVTYSGAPMQVGMKSAWKSKSQGNGEMLIQAMLPNKSMTYSLSFAEYDMKSNGEINLLVEGNSTIVVWRSFGKLGNNPIYRYFGLMMDATIGPDFASGLQNLKTLVEQQSE